MQQANHDAQFWPQFQSKALPPSNLTPDGENKKERRDYEPCCCSFALLALRNSPGERWMHGNCYKQSASRGTLDHHAANEPDGDRGANDYVHGGGHGNSIVELQMAEERRRHQRADLVQFKKERGDYGPCCCSFAWLALRNWPDERWMHGNCYNQFACRGTLDHHAASEPDGDRGADGHVH